MELLEKIDMVLDENQQDSLKQWKKILKDNGFTMLTKSYSWGKSATYKHKKSGDEDTGNVYSKESLEKWKPLHDLMSKNKALLDNIKKEYGYSGLSK